MATPMIHLKNGSQTYGVCKMTVPVHNDLSDLIVVTSLQSDLEMIKATVTRKGIHPDDLEYYNRLADALTVVLNYYTEYNTYERKD